jgi:hypothetical protein
MIHFSILFSHMGDFGGWTFDQQGVQQKNGKGDSIIAFFGSLRSEQTRNKERSERCRRGGDFWL